MYKVIRRFLTTLFPFLLACLFLSGRVETLRLKTTWGERVDLSEKIIRGQVVTVESYWNPERTLIYTDVTVLIDEYLKGDGPKKIVLRIPGGTVGNMTKSVSDTPQFAVGDYGVICLEPSGQVTGGPDGVYLLQREEGDRFLLWLRAYIAGDRDAPKEGPPLMPRLQHK